MLKEKQYCDSYEELREKLDLTTPPEFNFAFDVLDEIAKADPKRLAIRHVDNDGNMGDYSMEWLSKESAKAANALKASGIKKGDRVMVMLFRRLEFWVCLMALHKLGAVIIPGPAQLTPKDIAFRVQYGKIKGLVVEDTITDRVEEIRAECPSLELLVQVGGSQAPQGWLLWDDLMKDASDVFPKPSARDELACDLDPLLVFFSSGTTGMPKMVVHDHRYPMSHLVTGMYWHDLEPGDLQFTLADTGWGKAVWGKSYGQWMSGAGVLVYDFRGKFDPAALLKVLADTQVTNFCAPPTAYRFLVREDLSKYDLSKLRHCTTAGELLNESIFHEWKSLTGLPIHEGYGQTETTVQLATFPCMTPKPGSIGKPSPGWDIVLLDTEGNIVPPGEEGEICVRLDGENRGLFNGYLFEEDKTNDVKYDGFYHTGDKAWMDEDGYFWFLGRLDDLIKSSGYRIGPFEVESALVAHEAVVEAAVTSLPDPLRGQAVKATVVLAPGFEPTEETTKMLQDHVKNTTAPYKYPRVVEYVQELPKTISGKIRRSEIRDRDLKKLKGEPLPEPLNEAV